MKFYVFLGSMALMLFVTGCAHDTAPYSQTPAQGQTGDPAGFVPEEPPPATTETPAAPEAPTTAENHSEPKTPPPVNLSQPKPWQPDPSTVGTATQPPVSYPKATRVPGKTGRVISPYAPYAGEVDVSGLASGDLAKDPYTGKTFVVP